MFDAEQRIAAMSGQRAKGILEELVYALNGQSLTTPEEILHENALLAEKEEEDEE